MLSYGGLSETAGALAINRRMFLILHWDCLQGSGASTLHAEGKGSCYLLQRVWKKNLQYQCGSCDFPRPLLQVYYQKTKGKTCIQGAEKLTNTLQRGGKRTQMFQDRDTDRHSPVWNTGTDSRHFLGFPAQTEDYSFINGLSL